MQPYKIHILKYARRDATSSDILLGDPHRAPMDMAYYMWVVSNGEHTAVVDLGFTRAMCEKRGREWLHDPAEQMESIGVDPARVEHVIVSHLHWDHVGNYELFPRATFYLQEVEMAFWTGKYLRYPVFNQAIELEDIVAMVRYNYGGRVALVDGSRELLPGVKIHLVGGHTKGVQVTEVACASGTAVVTSDAVHTYRNLRSDTPFLILHDVPNYLEGYELARGLAADEDHILPGHDSEVMKRHPLVGEDIALLE